MTDVVVLCTRNRPEEVTRCLASIAAQVALPQHVLVVDSSDDDATRRAVHSELVGWPAGSRLEHVPSRPALTHQRAVGLARTQADIVHFVDDDVDLDPGYFAAVGAIFGAQPDVLGVGGYVTNRAAWRVRRIDTWFGLDSRREGAVLASGRNVPVRTRPDAPIDVDWLSGCAMSYRRAALELEPPDESYPFEGEDVQLSHRVRRHGRLVVTPEASLVHHESDAGRIAGAAQVQAELATRHRRVVAAGSGLSPRAFWLSAYAQLVKYSVSGVLTMSRRRIEIARGTARAMRLARLPASVTPIDASAAD